MLTHANLAANVRQILRYVGGREPGKDRMLGILPLFHVFAMTAVHEPRRSPSAPR